MEKKICRKLKRVLNTLSDLRVGLLKKRRVTSQVDPAFKLGVASMVPSFVRVAPTRKREKILALQNEVAQDAFFHARERIADHRLHILLHKGVRLFLLPGGAASVEGEGEERRELNDEEGDQNYEVDGEPRAVMHHVDARRNLVPHLLAFLHGSCNPAAARAGPAAS